MFFCAICFKIQYLLDTHIFGIEFLRFIFPPLFRALFHYRIRMRIKKVIIQGFGSYNKAENPEVFGPGINAIRKGHICFAES